jgi:hypothetical protein
MLQRSTLMLASLALVACAPDLRPINETPRDASGRPSDASDASADASAPAVGRVQTRATGDHLESVVDAQDNRAWVYVDLDRLAMADERMEGWDVAFNRFKAMTNGGSSGTAGVTVAILDGVSFEDARPREGLQWLSDQLDGDDANTDPDYALSAQGDGWFDYNSENHTLSPKDRTYLLRTSESRTLRFRWQRYYDAAGSPGVLTVQWGETPATR